MQLRMGSTDQTNCRDESEKDFIYKGLNKCIGRYEKGRCDPREDYLPFQIIHKINYLNILVFGIHAPKKSPASCRSRALSDT